MVSSSPLEAVVERHHKTPQRGLGLRGNDYGEGREPTRRFGDFVIMPGEGRPGFIWRTTEVTIKPLSEVDEAFAWDEGKGTARESGGSIPIAAISLGKRPMKGSR